MSSPSSDGAISLTGFNLKPFGSYKNRASVAPRLSAWQSPTSIACSPIKSPHPNLIRGDVIELARELLALGNASSSDPIVASQINRLRSMYENLSSIDRQTITNQLQGICNLAGPVLPGTAASFVCGCFQNSYGNVDRNCSLICTDNLASQSCNNTILHWSRTGSEIVSRGYDGICNVFIDPGVSVSTVQQGEFLSTAGCSTANYYNAVSNSSVNRESVALPSNPVSTIPTTVPTPVTRIAGGLGFWSIFLLVFIIIVLAVMMAWFWRKSKIAEITANP